MAELELKLPRLKLLEFTGIIGANGMMTASANITRTPKITRVFRFKSYTQTPQGYWKEPPLLSSGLKRFELVGCYEPSINVTIS